jgi:hypothetical protein
MMRNQGSPTSQPTGTALLPMRNNNEPHSFGSINRGNANTQKKKKKRGRTKKTQRKKTKTHEKTERTEERRE